MKPTLPTDGPSRRSAALLAGLAAVKAIGLILLAQAIAAGIAGLAAGTGMDLVPLLGFGAAGAVLRAGAVWGTQFVAQRAALGAKERLRRQLVGAALEGRLRPLPAGTGPARHEEVGHGALAALASRGLDGLDGYYAKYLPALVSAAVLPVFIGARILWSDWVSALILVLTVPLVPLFMALIGLHTQDRIARAAAGLDRLSNQLSELAQGLPALVGLRRARGRRQGLEAVSNGYRETTMGTLRTAFLSGLALELISTISVAVVAVFIGVRLAYGTMGLEAGLLALLLAPEVFLPLREVGAAFHDSEDGVEAMRRTRDLLPEEAAPAHETAPGPDRQLLASAENLSVTYAGSDAPASAARSFTLHDGEVLVLDGASGTGKTTVLHAVLGLLPAGTVTGGRLHVPRPGSTAWIPQHPRFTQATPAAELGLHAPQAGLQGIAAALAAVNAAGLADRELTALSPGELRRVAVARALARLSDPAVSLLVADEPTAHLDPASAQCVRVALASVRDAVGMMVATHDARLAEQLRERAGGTPDGMPGFAGSPAPGAASPACGAAEGGAACAALVPAGADVPATATKADSPTAAAANPASSGAAAPDEHASTALPGTWRRRWSLLRTIPWWRGGMTAGILLAAASVLAGAALTGVSGWLIVTASTQPPILLLMVAIVGVRFFGLARSVLRYAQQLAVHRAVLDWATLLRARLWDGLAERPAHWGRLSRQGSALRHLVADVDELRDAAPRALVPIPAAVLVWAATVATAWVLLPETAWVVAAAGLLGLLLNPLLVLRLERGSSVLVARHRSWLSGRIGTLVHTAGDLRANGAAEAALADFGSREALSQKPLLRTAAGAGLGQALAVLAAGLGALSAMGAVALQGGTGPAVAALAAVVVLLSLAMAEPFANAAEAAAQLPVLDDRLHAVHAVLTPDADESAPLAAGDGGTGTTPAGPRLQGLRVAGADIAWAGSEPVATGVDIRVERGEWLTVSGPSGAGKSSLLAVLLGILRPRRGALLLADENGRTFDAWAAAGGGEPADAAEAVAGLLGRIAWCPQEAHLFDSTLAANLSLARAATDPRADAELVEALEAVGLGSWFAEQSDGLATRLGSGGHRLSGGQRQRLAVARALVARADVVLLDEPTAHLGADEALELMHDLRRALAGAAVVMVTHDARLAAPGDARLRLGESVLAGVQA